MSEKKFAQEIVSALVALAKEVLGKGQKRLVIHYAGSGGSGGVDYVTVLGADPEPFLRAWLSIPGFGEPGYEMSVHEAVDHLVNYMLIVAEEGLTCFQDEGASGDITIDLETGEVSQFDHRTHYRASIKSRYADLFSKNSQNEEEEL